MFVVNAIGSAVAGQVVGGILGGSSSGGSTQTQNTVREPWAPAQPWLQNQVSQGQSLQNFYQNSPFNSAQTQAMGHMADQSAYIRSLIPSLLGQMSGGSYFDRSNPNARPTPFNFMGQGGGAAPTPSAMPFGQQNLGGAAGTFLGQISRTGLGGGMLGAPAGTNPISAMPAPSVINAPAPAPVAGPTVDQFKTMFADNGVPYVDQAFLY